jgi:hypothetical protein
VKTRASESSRVAVAVEFQAALAGALLDSTGTPFSQATKPSSNFIARSISPMPAALLTTKGKRAKKEGCLLYMGVRRSVAISAA